jgi:hypothetical protein
LSQPEVKLKRDAQGWRECLIGRLSRYLSLPRSG